jgi:hypothetical protein
MKTLIRCVLALLGTAGLAHARPVYIENVSTITNPNPGLWTGFPMDVAVSGDYAIVGAEYWEHVTPEFARLHQTAFLYRRSGNGWALERQLAETVVDQKTPRHWLTVDMSSAVAVVATTPLTFYEFGPSGWTQAPSDVPLMASSFFDIETDGNRVIIGEYSCASNAALIEKVAGVWRRTETLLGAPYECSPDLSGRAADISGNWAVVHQPRGAGIGETEQQAWIYRRSPSQGWVRHDAVSRPAVAWLYPGYTQLAIRGTDVFMSGDLDEGTIRFSADPAWNFELAERLRPVDGSMGSNIAAQLETSGDLLLQKTLFWDRSYQPAALNVWQRRADGTHEHVAVLAHRDNVEWGMPIYEGPLNNTAISGRTVLATHPNHGVYHFELPAAFSAPAPQQETFNFGAATNWSTSAGSQFATVRGDRSRVLRQSQLALDTRAIYQPADWTTEAIEVDVKAVQFADPQSAISLITRYQGPHNYYEFVWGPSRFEFRRMASGTLRTLLSRPDRGFGIQPGQNHRLRLESVGTRHQVFINGLPAVSIASTGPTRGRVGLATYRATADFDNVQITPSPLATIYRNDFFTMEPVAWRQSGVGDWHFEDGYDSDVRLVQTTTTGEGRVTIGTPSTEQSVEASARIMQLTPAATSAQWFGVVARYVDENNHFTLGLSNSNRLTLAKRVGGVRTVLGTFVVELVPEQYYHFRLDAVGDQLRAYLDDRLLFERTDADHPTGSVGMVTSRAYVEFDSFNAHQP